MLQGLTLLQVLINPENVVHDVTAIDLEQQSAQSSDGSYIETYTSDPSYTAPDYRSPPCGKHGACQAHSNKTKEIRVLTIWRGEFCAPPRLNRI